MTDNEIIKALECCTNYPACPTDCPLYKQPMDCLLKLSKPTFDLINRQKAEIEQYKARILNDIEYTERVEVENKNQKVEIERLKTENRILSQKRINFFERIEIITAAEASAVKEFADEFKKIAVCGKTSVFRFPYYQISMEAFDNLVKKWRVRVDD